MLIVHEYRKNRIARIGCLELLFLSPSLSLSFFHRHSFVSRAIRKLFEEWQCNVWLKTSHCFNFFRIVSDTACYPIKRFCSLASCALRFTMRMIFTDNKTRIYTKVFIHKIAQSARYEEV